DALERLLPEVDRILKKQAYSIEEAAIATGLSLDQLRRAYLTRFPVDANLFQLHDRAQHVYAEAARVCRFRQLCATATTGAATQCDLLLQALGTLMNASQESCRDLYECSCPELDTLVSVCRDHGAYGARLTGAGWGGCCVALVALADADQFLERVTAEYYGNYADVADVDITTAAFACRAGEGAHVIAIKGQ
ncbi:GHMP kinase, partial [Thamnocephalis sphaerospora]